MSSSIIRTRGEPTFITGDGRTFITTQDLDLDRIISRNLHIITVQPLRQVITIVEQLRLRAIITGRSQDTAIQEWVQVIASQVTEEATVQDIVEEVQAIQAEDTGDNKFPRIYNQLEENE